MTFLIDNRTNFELTDEIKETLEKVCLKSLQYEEFNEDCEISLSIVTNDEIHDINKQFRNIDSPTDVLSFPQLTFEEGEEADVNENGEIVLGDIIISIDRAKEQAEEYGHSLKRELAFLSVQQYRSILWAMTIWYPRKKRICSADRRKYLSKPEYPENKRCPL